MIKKYKCSECKNIFENDLGISAKRYKYVEGQVVDYYTNKPLDKVICPECNKENVVEILDGVPSLNFPLSDLDFSISKKRMQDGLYNDMSHKSKEKSKELKEEMQHHNSKININE